MQSDVKIYNMKGGATLCQDLSKKSLSDLQSDLGINMFKNIKQDDFTKCINDFASQKKVTPENISCVIKNIPETCINGVKQFFSSLSSGDTANGSDIASCAQLLPKVLNNCEIKMPKSCSSVSGTLLTNYYDNRCLVAEMMLRQNRQNAEL